MERPVWQIAAGERGRYYDDIFLAHDVMFLGPGNFGPYSEAEYDRAVQADELDASRRQQVRQFCTEVTPGDIVLVRRGYRVVAVGLVPEDGYRWEESLDDVYGWDLQHCRRVAWQPQLCRALEELQSSGRGDLFAARKQIPTFTRVRDEAVLKPLQAVLAATSARDLRPNIPTIPRPLTLDALREELFIRGLPFENCARVCDVFAKQRGLDSWYRRFAYDSGRPSEHEVVAHMLLPLLLALGWSEQLLAVEWQRIDLAAFSRSPTAADSCVLVCEAKHRDRGLQDDLDQGQRYVQQLGLATCHKILLTNGTRYYLYEGAAAPVGYLNVVAPRLEHLAPAQTNAVDTIMALTPMRVQLPFVRHGR